MLAYLTFISCSSKYLLIILQKYKSIDLILKKWIIILGKPKSLFAILLIHLDALQSKFSICQIRFFAVYSSI